MFKIRYHIVEAVFLFNNNKVQEPFPCHKLFKSLEDCTNLGELGMFE